MRVLFGLLLLALSAVSAQTIINPDATNTFHITSGSNIITPVGWNFTSNGQVFLNPTLNMSVGTTYFISIEFDTTDAFHPFGLNTINTSTTVSEFGLVNVNTSCTGSATAGYSTTKSCLLSFTPSSTTPTNLYYHCAYHQLMVGKIQLNGAATAAPATTAPPTIITGASIVADSANTFHITGGDRNLGWYLTSNGQQYQNPTLNMTAGTTYFFSIEFDTVASFHPFGLNAVSATGTNPLVPDTTLGLTNTTVCVTAATAKGGFQAQPKCTLSFTPNANNQAVYYHCLNHPAMVGQIQVLGASGSTTSPPTAPHGSASALVPGVAAVFAAFAGFAAL